MNLNFLDFEQPIAELEAKIEELRYIGNDADLNITDEIARLKQRSQELTRTIFSNLTAHQVSRIARHPQRPYTLDYIQRICTDFEELHGDRTYGDDPAIICGLARIDGVPIVIIGHQKGRNTQENIQRNYGMAKPEGYRKALRVMKLADRFGLPLVTLIDTPGAYPGIDAEERGQSEAIARNLYEMAGLRVPLIASVIGEGGSGGALAIGIADRIIMLEYSTYSVISPEGCAAILWKSADKAGEAAEALGLTSSRLRELGLVDLVVPEPLGGAHRNIEETAARLKAALLDSIGALRKLSATQLVEQRYERLMRYGQFARS